MKKRKKSLSLDVLKVRSFVTNDVTEHLKGGSLTGATLPQTCMEDLIANLTTD